MNDLDTLVDEAINLQPQVSPVALRLNEDEANTGGSADGGEGPETLTDSAPSAGANPPTTVSVPPATSYIGTQPGESFDPETHVTDEAGNPIRNLDGSYRKKRGRKKGQSYGPRAAGETVNGASQVLVTDDMRLQKAAASARAVVSSMVLVGSMIGGDEWAPIKDAQMGIDEMAILTNAYTEYFLTCENLEMPSWIGVAIATSSYVIPRMSRPKTQSRMAGFWQWCKSLFGKSEDANLSRIDPSMVG